MTVKPPNNDRFLEAVFGQAPGVFTASFRGPMSGANWNRNPFCSDPASNNYFCVSTIGGDGRRTPENATALHVIMIDDVGTKLDSGKVAGIMGAPTYIIETSPNNEQWGYVLDPPCTDAVKAEGLVRAAKNLFTADAAGRNRLARLPYGTNGKNGHVTRLVLWEPQKRLTPDQAWTHLEAVAVPPSELIPTEALPIDQDLILKAMDLLGHPYSPTRTQGLYTVQCPWLAEHSDGRDDGAAYISPAGFKCHHGHCSSRTFRDFRSFLGVPAVEVDDAIAEAAFGITAERKSDFEVAEKGAEEAAQPHGGEVVAAPLHPWLSETPREYTVGNRYMTLAEAQKKFPRTWLFENTIPMNVPWALVGEGGLGKSRIALAMCMSIATGVPFGDDFVPAISEGAPAVFLTQEDDKPDRVHRFLTQYEHFCERDARWRSEKVFNRLNDNLFIPTLVWGQHLDIEFRHRYKRFLDGLNRPIRLAFYDPFVLFMDHSDPEASINSAAGAINTMGQIIKTTKAGQDDIPFSVGMAHHMNKAHEIYGSALIRAHLRVVFDILATEEPDKTLMKVSKVNSSPIMGKKWDIALSENVAAVYPTTGLEFAEQTHEERLATCLKNGTVPWDQTVAKVVAAASKLAMFGPVTDRRDRLEEILAQWHKDTPGSADRIEVLGLEHAKFGRFKPVAGVAD